MYFLILGGGDPETGIRRSMSLQVILFIFYHCITDMVISDISRSNEWSLEVQITCLCSNMCTLRSHRHIIIAVFNVEFLHWELIFFNVKHRQNYGKLIVSKQTISRHLFGLHCVFSNLENKRHFSQTEYIHMYLIIY